MRIKGASASEGRPADTGSAHSCELMPLLLSPQDCDREGTWAHFTNGANGCDGSWLLTPPWARRLHSRPHVPFTSTLHGRCCSGPLSTGGGCASDGSSTSLITQPTGSRGSEQSFLPPGTRLGHHPRPHVTQDTQSRALMRRWRTFMAACPAAHPSFLHLQSPQFVLQQQVSPAQG